MSAKGSARVGGLAAADAAPPAMVFVNDRDSEGVIRQALNDLGVAAPYFGAGGIDGAISELGKRSSPHLLIVDISGVEEAATHIGRLADVCEPGTGVVVIGERNDITLYRDLKNAGVIEYFYKPVYGAAIARSANAVLTGDTEQQAVRTGRLIYTLGVRGGAGTTTVGIRLAWHLAQERKRRTAVIDLDLHSGDAALQLNVTPHHALREALDHPDRIDELFLERGMVRVTERLNLLASEEPLDQPTTFTEDALLTLMDKVMRGYRYIFVDVPASIAMTLPRALHLPSLCLLVSDGSLVSAREVARWRALIGANTAQRNTLHLLNKADAPGSLPVEEFSRAAGQAPDVIIPYERDVAQMSNLGIKRLEECQGFMRALGPALRKISGEGVEEERTLLSRLLGR